jgi:23S rRNA (adenine2503-C2)-methyltransferase
MPYLFDKSALTDYCKEQKIPSFRIKQIQQAIFTESLLDPNDITTLAKDLREQLSNDFDLNTFTLETVSDSDETTKFLFKLADGNVIETVLMYHWHEKESNKDTRKILRSRTDHKISEETHTLNRITICVSSQVGCAVGCVFCVTGKLGFKKNLSREEIVLQLLYCNNFIKQKFGKKEDGTRNRLRNVVFMGMGEPLLNYDNMKTSIEYMLAQDAFGLSKRHITISTSWVASYIDKLVTDGIDVRLALSLHAPNQELRAQLIPMIGKKRPIDELMKSVDAYEAATGNRIFYEYIMIKDTTDTQPIAHQLGILLQVRNAHVNLIPYNENPAMPDLVTSDYDVILAFKKTVENYGVTVTVRDTLWRNVKWACWQLGYEKIMKERIEQMDAENNGE